MRGLDTNILVRFCTNDDPAQVSLVKALFEEAEGRNEAFFVSSVALCELVWSLRRKPYRLSRTEVATVLEKILDTGIFEIQDRNLVRHALSHYRQGRADFADYLLGAHGRRAGCEVTLTFDRQLSKSPGFSLLT
jgi:predicted nucleic-acid-binding protein